MILRGGAGASACQRSAKDDESPFRLSTLRVVSRKAIATADNVKLFFAWNLLPAGEPHAKGAPPESSGPGGSVPRRSAQMAADGSTSRHSHASSNEPS